MTREYIYRETYKDYNIKITITEQIQHSFIPDTVFADITIEVEKNLIDIFKQTITELIDKTNIKKIITSRLSDCKIAIDRDIKRTKEISNILEDMGFDKRDSLPF